MDFKQVRLRLQRNLNILQERAAKYAGNAPPELLNQIEDHQTVIQVTEQAIDGELSEAEWREALQPLNIDHTLIEGGFFQKVLKALSLPSEQQRDLRNREIMLQRVYDFWIKGVLENSLHNEVLIELDMETKPEAVDYPWEMVIQRPDQPNRTLPPNTKMIDVFDESGGSLLILGEPGSGKTTMLLELARESIAQAETNPDQPVPVVFNLSTWAEKQPPMAEWLVDELRSKYNVPRKIAEPWVQDDRLLPMLDGLDEVVLVQRDACVKAINAYRADHWVSLVVCSRIADYETLRTKLKLQEAVLLLPLSAEQVGNYFDTIGAEFQAVREAIDRDSMLQEMMNSPLILSIATLAYQGLSSEVLEIRKTVEAWRKHLFNTYIERMFQRREVSQPYAPEQMTQWLGWLAQKMLHHDQTIFLIENLQPSWFHARRWHLVYTLSSRLIVGMLVGLLVGLILGLISGRVIVGPSELPFFGLVSGLIYGLIGLIVGLIWGSIVELRDSFTKDIQMVEVLYWSWGKTLIGGLILGVVIGLVVGLIWGLKTGLFIGLIGGQIGVIFNGLNREIIETKTVPNQGVRLSVKHAIFGGLISGLVSGLFGLVWFLLLDGELRMTRLIWWLFVMGTFGILGALWYGGSAVVKHYTLRFFLWQIGYLPFHLAPFLDYCVDRIFLRRVGGGYIFIHRYLMEYFASLTEEDIERLSAEIEAR